MDGSSEPPPVPSSPIDPYAPVAWHWPQKKGASLLAPQTCASPSRVRGEAMSLSV